MYARRTEEIASSDSDRYLNHYDAQPPGRSPLESPSAVPAGQRAPFVNCTPAANARSHGRETPRPPRQIQHGSESSPCWSTSAARCALREEASTPLFTLNWMPMLASS